ncbi:acyltransferase family protein [Methylobacterium planeticum]|uniref:Acyltransferase n=1 Tax=Methylobacterium planeticum TaxID=2615211 RepID=A0A6N6MLJ6_9HYPH|nr:acyltransferase [Methylobacterium planeticum]KAB1072122.1 acyltransferase [Methylobacterium planeticum]
MKLILVQILRGGAALLVATHHAQHEAGLLAARTGQAFAPSALLPWAAGVDVFFVISGFIIVHAAAPLYGQPGARAHFLAHRVARVVPLYWLVTALYLALALAAPGMLGAGGADLLEPGYVAASFLFWPALRPDGTPQPLYTLGWTLNCEMFFYALFALGLGWRRRGAVAWILAALGLLTLVNALAPGLPLPLAFWTNPIILEFALGAALGLARAEGARLPGPARLGLALAGVAGLALAEPLLGAATGFGRPLGHGVPAALLVAAAALGRPRRVDAPIPAPLLWAGAVGDASYALYLVHPFVLRGAREAILRLGLAPGLGPWGSLALMLALTVPAALLVHRLVERPLTARARALLDPAPRGIVPARKTV